MAEEDEPILRFSSIPHDMTICDGFERQPIDVSTQGMMGVSSFEFLESSNIREQAEGLTLLNVNAGGKSVVSGGIDFQEDEFFTGGNIIRTEAKIGGVDGLELFRSARYGNFKYNFQNLVAGEYVVDLHFAEIVFTNGPPGMRIFDVYIQEEKVVSGLDIYAQVGYNQPLILSDLKTPKFSATENQYHIITTGESRSITCDYVLVNDGCVGCSCNARLEVLNLRRDYESLMMEQGDTRRALEDARKENELKMKECHEAWMSLHELQNELMRKSMHVGSLAYAVEGQVKEKSQWFSSLEELSRKLELLKMEHAELSNEALQCNSFLTDLVHLRNQVQLACKHVAGQANLEKEHACLKVKYIEEVKEKKDLYNKVLELKGNIRVFCRCRPQSTDELAAGASMAIDFESAKDGELIIKSNGGPRKVFKFDSVFNPQADQETVFENTAPFATSVLDGYNVSIFAYGQTGTGKTFTMEGTEEARGVNYRTLEELFRIMKERRKLFLYEITVSVMEVYNEQIRDLLQSDSQPGSSNKRLEIRQVAEGVHHVPGLVEARVSNMSEVWEVLQTGSNARAVGSTNANEHSSRSHWFSSFLPNHFITLFYSFVTYGFSALQGSIHCVMVRGENLINGECTSSKLWLIDLAGSERVAKTDVQGERLKEAQNINKSLSALGDVISALATKSPHVPFRNSKLTHLLQDSLGGDSKTLMLVQISPNEDDVSETLCSLNFASRVRGIELGPAKKQYDNERSRYKQMVEKSKQDAKGKDMYIKKLEEMVQGLESKVRAKDVINKNLQEKVKELESQLLVERKLARQHVDSKIAETHQQQKNHHQEPQNALSTRPPLATRQLDPPPNINSIRPFPESTTTTTTTTNIFKHFQALKENDNPNISSSEHHPPPPPLPKKTGRVSLCTMARRVPMVPAPRRNSLIPFPPLNSLAPTLPPLVQVDSIRESANEGELLLPQIVTEPTKISNTKKLNSILRRSLQKKVIIRSPLQQHLRRSNNNSKLGGAERLRVSITGRRRIPKVVKESQQKREQQQQKEKGWNHVWKATKFIF
ncbi:Kinesin-4 [Acorus calamus]|uniref:Kinesin-4 n=1 Tax=Acorus calamus TaxID=4465 RepID=A0AAV9C3B2_ACOCL|nr:Kinesin-4 [Acorus calamus]